MNVNQVNANLFTLTFTQWTPQCGLWLHTEFVCSRDKAEIDAIEYNANSPSMN